MIMSVDWRVTNERQASAIDTLGKWARTQLDAGTRRELPPVPADIRALLYNTGVLRKQNDLLTTNDVHHLLGKLTDWLRAEELRRRQAHDAPAAIEKPAPMKRLAKVFRLWRRDNQYDP